MPFRCGLFFTVTPSTIVNLNKNIYSSKVLKYNLHCKYYDP